MIDDFGDAVLRFEEPDLDLRTPSPGRAACTRRRFRPRPAELPTTHRSGGGGSSRSFSDAALRRIACMHLRCECGWEGGFLDLELLHHRCPVCKRDKALERDEDLARDPLRWELEDLRNILFLASIASGERDRHAISGPTSEVVAGADHPACQRPALVSCSEKQS